MENKDIVDIYIQYNLVICIAPSEPKKVIIGRFNVYITDNVILRSDGFYVRLLYQ